MPVSNIINKSSTINSSNISNSSSNLSDNHSITSSSSSSSSEEDSEEEEEEDLDFKVKKSLRKGSLLVSDTSRRNTRSSQERNKSSSASEKVVRVRKNSEKVELNLLSLSTSKSGKSKELSSSSKPKEVINKKNPRRNSSLTPTSTTSATTSNLLLEVKLEPISTSTTTRVSEASPSLPLLTTVLPKRSQQSPFPSHLNNLPMTIPIQSLISIPLHRQFSFIPSTSTTPASTNSTSSPLNPTSSSSSNALKCNTCNQSIELPIQVLDSLALKTSLWTLPSPIPSTNNKKRTRKELESEGKVEVVEETTLTPLERSELTSHRSKCGGIASIGTLLPSPSPPTPITTSTTAQPKSKKPKKGYVTILLPPSSPPTSTSTSTSPPPLSLNPLVPTKPIPFSRPSARKWYKSRRLTETLPATMNTRKVLYTNPVVIEKVWNGRSGVAVGVSSLMKVIIERGEKERISREKLVKGRKFLVTIFNSPTLTPRAFHFGGSPNPTPTEPYHKKCTFLTPTTTTYRTLPSNPTSSYVQYSYIFPPPVKKGDIKGKLKVRLSSCEEGVKDRSYVTNEWLGDPGMEMIVNREGKGVVEWACDSDPDDDSDDEDDDAGND